MASVQSIVTEVLPTDDIFVVAANREVLNAPVKIIRDQLTPKMEDVRNVAEKEYDPGKSVIESMLTVLTVAGTYVVTVNLDSEYTTNDTSHIVLATVNPNIPDTLHELPHTRCIINKTPTDKRTKTMFNVLVTTTDDMLGLFVYLNNPGAGKHKVYFGSQITAVRLP